MDPFKLYLNVYRTKIVVLALYRTLKMNGVVSGKNLKGEGTKKRRGEVRRTRGVFLKPQKYLRLKEPVIFIRDCTVKSSKSKYDRTVP